MLKHSFYIGLIAVILAACSKPVEHVYYLEGIVLDDIDQTPVVGARVSVERPSTGWFSSPVTSDTVFTDDLGVFFIELPKTTDFFGGSITVDPTRIHFEHPDYCQPFGASFSVEAESAPTTQLLYRIDPKAYGQVTATNTGAFTGNFDEVDISEIGEVSLENGAVTAGDVFERCHQLNTTAIIVRYKLENALVHQETYTFALTRKDTLSININY